jgi:protein-S-isoprenylcysteine O-methyltransferase Ste14
VKAGAFRFSRHPGNLGALGFFLFLPRMTANRAVLLALVGLYVVLGSLHEEHGLRAAYGAAYERYRRAVPFLIPPLRDGRSEKMIPPRRVRVSPNDREPKSR